MARALRCAVRVGSLSLLLAVPSGADGSRAETAASPVRSHGRFVAANLGLGMPTGYCGISAGWKGRRWGADAGYGRGETGHQFAVMGRFMYRPDVGLGTGPSLALKGPGVGLDIGHVDEIDTTGKTYFASWWNTEMFVDWNAKPKPVRLRGTGGFMVRLGENMSPLLPENPEYKPPFFLDYNASTMARRRFSLYIGVSAVVHF